MEAPDMKRSKWLHLRLKPTEYNQIHLHFTKTTCRKMSEYARKVLLHKPLTSTYRNQSLDDFMAEMMRLRQELNGLANNFNQAVKKLHMLHQMAEFRTWLITWELERKILLNKVDEIKKGIDKIADQWLQ